MVTDTQRVESQQPGEAATALDRAQPERRVTGTPAPRLSRWVRLQGWLHAEWAGLGDSYGGQIQDSGRWSK